MRERILRKRHITALILILTVLIILTECFFSMYRQNRKTLLREKVGIQANKVQLALNHEINSSINLILGMIAYIKTVDNLSVTEFNKLSEILLSESDIIRNIVMAPDNVISYIYPLEGNEEVLGINYIEDERFKEAVVRAIKTGRPIIAGPINLLTGGTGFSVRIPIFRDKEKKDYLGIVGIVIDEIKFYDKISILHDWQWLIYALKGKDAKGSAGEQFFGDEAVFKNDPVILNILLPEGSWILGACPKDGWDNINLYQMIYFRFTGYIFAFLVTFMLYHLMRSNMKLSYFANIDPLTGISNRRFFHSMVEKLLLREKRENGKLFFIFFDLDGFKSVNDNFGHKAGDAVLIETVARIEKITRESDLFARMGGDEFLFVPLSVRSADDAKILTDKIIREISAPYYTGKNVIKIGCSIGVCVYPDDSVSIDSLIKLSDQAMYTSKSRKTNTVTFYGDIETVFIGE